MNGKSAKAGNEETDKLSNTPRDKPGCRGGGRYVEGCYGFPYLKKFIGFFVYWFLVCWFLVLGIQRFKYHDPLGVP